MSTVKELRKIASGLKIPGRSKMNKAALITAISVSRKRKSAKRKSAKRKSRKRKSAKRQNSRKKKIKFRMERQNPTSSVPLPVEPLFNIYEDYFLHPNGLEERIKKWEDIRRGIVLSIKSLKKEIDAKRKKARTQKAQQLGQADELLLQKRVLIQGKDKLENELQRVLEKLAALRFQKQRRRRRTAAAAAAFLGLRK